ncbi:MAG: hypothetical protein JWO05_747 [Gemmatimonadetes bacterium]|nr:hypothetical protein [Gemmatimonadota bacterium]
MSRRGLPHVVLVLLLGGCVDTSARADSAVVVPGSAHAILDSTYSVAPALPAAPAADWTLFFGNGFSFRYPPEATTSVDTIGGERMLTIRGPVISLRTREYGTRAGPSWQVNVHLSAGPAGTRLEPRFGHDIPGDEKAQAALYAAIVSTLQKR